MRRERAPARTLAAVALTVTGLAACGGGIRPQPAASSLAGACQMSACRCVEANTPFWQAAKTIDVQWRETGEAYCPEGYELRRVTKPKPAGPGGT